MHISANERRILLGGRSPLPHFLESLATSNYKNNYTPYYARLNVKQQLKHLFIVSHSSKEITVCFSAIRVFLIDATYKINRFRLPLLHILGVTATNNSCTFAYCIMRNETEDDYIWAMNNLRRILGIFDITTPKHSLLTAR